MIKKIAMAENFIFEKHKPLKVLWLSCCLFLVILMILVGGYTRLTDSGLSIVEWQPISGIVPPTSELKWQEEFSKYKNYPEYQQHNHNISVEDFKVIYWVEFAHRLLGRMTGLVFLLPLLYFYFIGKIRSKDSIVYFATSMLLALQGFMGWYMVKSGLINDPRVSHYRLAVHLIIAFVIYSLIYWQLMKNYFDILIISTKINLQKLKVLSVITIIILFIQIFLGGLTAGLEAGLVYNSFPLMGDNFIPLEVTQYTPLLERFSDPVFIQFLHRMNAYGLLIIALILIGFFIQSENNKLKIVAVNIFFSLLIQVVLGVFTLLYQVPITLALAHQLGAIALLSSLLWGFYLLRSV